MISASYIIEMDTLLSRGFAAEGALNFIRMLEEEGMPYVILSEQCGRIRDHIADYFQERGFRYIRPGYIYTSSMAAVDFLVARYPERNRAGMIGGVGINEVLQKGGYHITMEKPDFILVGMNRKATYDTYSEAIQAIRDGAQIISTDNRITQMVDGQQTLGNASVVKMLEYASNTESISFGRGTKNFLLMAARFLHRKPEECVVIGNNFRKDIIPANELGMMTVFVTEGKSIMNLGMNEEAHPDFIVEDLNGLTK